MADVVSITVLPQTPVSITVAGAAALPGWVASVAEVEAAEAAAIATAEGSSVPLSQKGAPSGVASLTAGSIGAQPPAHHASTHAEGGGDPLTTADLPVSVVTNTTLPRLALGGVPVATRVSSLCLAAAGMNLFKATGAVLGQTSIIRCTAVRAAGGLRLVFGNWSKAAELPPNAIKVQAGVEAKEHEGTGERVVYVVTFNGQEEIKLAKGALVVSDSIPMDLAAGETFFVRTYVSVEKEGEEWPIDMTTIPGNGEGVANSVDKAHKEGIATSTTQFYGPVGIVAASPPQFQKVIAQIGDSIISGQDGVGEDSEGGWLLRALNSAWGYMKASKGGDTAKAFSEALRSQSRMKLVDPCSHAVVAYGTNDFGAEGRTVAQVKANLTTIYERLIRRGMKVYGVTITPRPKESTDGWATVENQVLGVHNTEIQEVNAWIREGAGGCLSGYVEAAYAVESAHGSGKWNAPGYTSEGIHPTELGHAAIAAALTPAALFT